MISAKLQNLLPSVVEKLVAIYRADDLVSVFKMLAAGRLKPSNMAQHLLLDVSQYVSPVTNSNEIHQNIAWFLASDTVLRKKILTHRREGIADSELQLYWWPCFISVPIFNICTNKGWVCITWNILIQTVYDVHMET